MRFVLVFLFVLALPSLAGCSGGSDDDAPAVELPPGTGAIEGVVVDQAIRPVAGATVTMQGGPSPETAETSDDGAFRFDAVVPGNYVLAVSHLLYGPVQGSVQVDEGEVARPKLQIDRLFTQEAFHETLKYEGFIQCGYSVSGALSSVCVNDYTHFVGLGYTCPDCEHLVDSRSHNFGLGPGWQTMVYEMTWEPSAQGTSPEMRLIVSHFPRPASHWYCSGSGPNPVYIRMDLGVVCEDQQDEPELVPPEGLPNMHIFAATSAPQGQPASVAISQQFSVFMNLFYYGAVPDGWSFVNGDPFPF